MLNEALVELIKQSRANVTRIKRLLDKIETENITDAEAIGIAMTRISMDNIDVNNKLMDIIKTGTMGQSYRIITENEEYNKRIDKVLKYLEDNAPSIKTSINMKNGDTRRNDKVKDDELVYKYKIEKKSPSQIAREVGMSMAGVKLRLEKCNEYEGKKSDYGVTKVSKSNLENTNK